MMLHTVWLWIDLICEKEFPVPLRDSRVARDCTVASTVSSEKGRPLDWRAELNLESIRLVEAVSRAV